MSLSLGAANYISLLWGAVRLGKAALDQSLNIVI